MFAKDLTGCLSETEGEGRGKKSGVGRGREIGNRSRVGRGWEQEGGGKERGKRGHEWGGK